MNPRCPKCEGEVKIVDEILLELMGTIPATIYKCKKCGYEFIR